jgi:IS30 family transposase
MSHHHFTLEDRNTIQNGLEDGKSNREIALKLGVSHTAVNDEVRHNSVVLEIVATTRVNKPRILSLDLRTRRGKGEVPEKVLAGLRYQKRLARFARGQPAYVADVAHTLYLERRRRASSLNFKLRDGEELAERIADSLFSKAKDSPEQIAANLGKEGTDIGYQTIYRWIKRSNRSKELTKRLRRRGKAYRYSHSTKEAWNKTKHKRSIHERPIEIEELTAYGDLEGDTIFGSDKKDRILTHVDRLTGVISLSLVLGYDSDKVHRQTVKDLKRVFGSQVRSVTYDNGSEFTAWQKTERALDLRIYFADAYKSCQRGRNENANGLVRDYYPKGTDFKKITKRDLREVEDILNNRSRKRYNWNSPIEQRELVLAKAQVESLG